LAAIPAHGPGAQLRYALAGDLGKAATSTLSKPTMKRKGAVPTSDEKGRRVKRRKLMDYGDEQWLRAVELRTMNL